jgi:hypothetical protein
MRDVRYLSTKRRIGLSWFSAGLIDVAVYPELIPFCVSSSEGGGSGLGCLAPAAQGHRSPVRSLAPNES